jgi:hypothetical protein
MKVIQLRRMLRTLPSEMHVLIKETVGVYGAHESDFSQLELTGQWGPKALLISPHELPFRRHRPFKPAEKSRPIERVREHQHWVASKPQREAWAAYARAGFDSMSLRQTPAQQLEELTSLLSPESKHPPRLE